MVRLSERQTRPPCFQGEQQDRRSVRGLELVDDVSPIPGRTVQAKKVEFLLFQMGFDLIEIRPLGENQGFGPLKYMC